MAAPIPKEDTLEESYTDSSIHDLDVEESRGTVYSPGDSTSRVVKPKWVNPCGVMLDETAHDPDMPSKTDSEIAKQADLEVTIALGHVETFKDEYVRNVFQMNFDEVTRTWAHVHYDWLPADDVVPKQIGDKVPASNFAALEFGPTLRKLYLALQKIAVGLEQVVLDRAVYGGNFLEQFTETEDNLRMVLCALQVAMSEKHIEPDTDAARQLMSHDYRDMRNESGRNLRDFIILRDYTNLLEYIQQFLEHFQNAS